MTTEAALHGIPVLRDLERDGCRGFRGRSSGPRTFVASEADSARRRTRRGCSNNSSTAAGQRATRWCISRVAGGGTVWFGASPTADLTPLAPAGPSEAFYFETSYSEHWGQIVYDFLKPVPS